MKLSVVVPARNEAGNITRTLDLLANRLGEECVDYEIVVVDDGSTDGTGAAVEARSKSNPRIRLVVNHGRHGFGCAVRCGLDAFTGDAVVVFMADCSDRPEDLVKYFYILRDHADCAFGSRFSAGGAVHDYPWFKLWLNRLGNFFIRVLFRLRYNDVTNGFKGYRRAVIEGCRPFISPHFNLTVEIPLKAIVRGYTHEITPIHWFNRREGRSAFRIKEMGSRYMFTILTIWLEKLLTKDDYKRIDSGEFVPWTGGVPKGSTVSPDGRAASDPGTV